MAEIISDISGIANCVALPRHLSEREIGRWSDAGFLVSGYSADKYAELAARKHFYAVVLDKTPVSFLVAYASDEEVDPSDLGSVFIRNEFGSASLIVKQVATRPNNRGHGFAKLLYERFADLARDDIYAAIVGDPPNFASEAFHKAIGCSQCATFAHPDGKPRNIWRKAYI